MDYKCAFGCTSYNSNCDACESYSNDSDTGWGGFFDHGLNKHFNSDKEKEEFIKNNPDYDSDD